MTIESQLRTKSLTEEDFLYQNEFGYDRRLPSDVRF